MFCSVHLGVQMDIRELNSTMMTEGRGGGVIGASRGGNRQWGMALSMARNIFDNN